MEQCYIYRIYFNDVDNYIGSTVNFPRRKWQHFNDLINNKHHNAYLQNVFDKYGKETFNIEIIDTCNRTQRNEVEKYYITASKYKSTYNLALNPNVSLNFYQKGQLTKNDVQNIFTMASNFENSSIIGKLYNLHQDFIRNILKRKYYAFMSHDINLDFDYNKYKVTVAKQVQRGIHKKIYYLYSKDKELLGTYSTIVEAAENYNVCEKALRNSLNKYATTGYFITDKPALKENLIETPKQLNLNLKTSVLHIFDKNFKYIKTLSGYTDTSIDLQISRASINKGSRYLTLCSKQYYVVRDFDIIKFENKYNIITNVNITYGL